MSRKLKREVLNRARELDLSGWRFLACLLWSRATRHGDPDAAVKLDELASTLAYFPRNPFHKRQLSEALTIARAVNRAGRESEELVPLSYCVILKPYVSELEKGILLVSFENQLARLLDSGRIGDILARHHIIFVPSWSGLYSKELFRLVAVADNNPVFVMPVHRQERQLVSRLGANCYPLPFNAASWVNASFFEGPVLERDIDCLMVANFASFKRHWLLFKALASLPEEIKATCVGVPLGSRTAASVRKEAVDYGVSDRVTIVENPTQAELRRYFRRAKVFCAMSYREGSFIAVAESLMSGTPVLMFRDAHVGTKDLITAQTGALVESVKELQQRILDYRDFRDHDNVRRTSIEVISAQANSHRLNNILKTWSTRAGRNWTVDIEGFYSQRLEFHYLSEHSVGRLAAEYDHLSSLGLDLSRVS